MTLQIYNAIAFIGVALMVRQTLPLSIPRLLPRESRTLVAQPSAESYYRWGLAKAKSEDFEGAIADFSEAIRLKPNFADA
jgi:hypothetical protein